VAGFNALLYARQKQGNFLWKKRDRQMIKIAVVGFGYWGPNLVRNFNAVAGCTVGTVCDADARRLEHLKSLYPNIETTSRFETIIQDPEIGAVVIATPVRFHFEMAQKSLEAGKHTFIEKPMASSVAQCKELVAIAKQNKLTLMVGHTFIYSTPVQKIKEIVDSGELGELYYISARRLNLGLFQKDINVAWDLAPHDISIVLHIANKLPVSVNCQGKAHMTLNFADGFFSVIQSSWLDPNKVRELTFVGSKKMLVYNDIEQNEKLKIYDKRVDVPPHYDTFAEFQYSYHYGDMHSPYIKMTEPLKVECEHFIDCIKTGRKPLTGGPQGLQVVRILEAAKQSLTRGGAAVDISFEKE
jgi:predicted dehydrogenase